MAKLGNQVMKNGSRHFYSVSKCVVLLARRETEYTTTDEISSFSTARIILSKAGLVDWVPLMP